MKPIPYEIVFKLASKFFGAKRADSPEYEICTMKT